MCQYAKYSGILLQRNNFGFQITIADKIISDGVNCVVVRIESPNNSIVVLLASYQLNATGNAPRVIRASLLNSRTLVYKGDISQPPREASQFAKMFSKNLLLQTLVLITSFSPIRARLIVPNPSNPTNVTCDDSFWPWESVPGYAFCGTTKPQQSTYRCKEARCTALAFKTCYSDPNPSSPPVWPPLGGAPIKNPPLKSFQATSNPAYVSAWSRMIPLGKNPPQGASGVRYLCMRSSGPQLKCEGCERVG
ncbi:hypothetical protein O181_002336 [Austropuccinia psidii MF-1]|uniref:Uncharacterized protein n=1 Tax=Austropuccinia psidii MF-1 TaxID=1389203 RepID=A0A9Q3BCT5_9BASI|nr:hypothetical protein [Austropuccinia psidii MF-1]